WYGGIVRPCAAVLRSRPRPGKMATASSVNLLRRVARRASMIGFVLALILAGALIAPSARAQTPETEDNRYQFNRVEDGYLRLDLKTGQVSLCSRRPVG